MPNSGVQWLRDKTLSGYSPVSTLAPSQLLHLPAWAKLGHSCTKRRRKAVLIGTFHRPKLLTSSLKNRLHQVVCIFCYFLSFWEQVGCKDFSWSKKKKKTKGNIHVVISNQVKPLPKFVNIYQKIILGFNYYEVYGSILLFFFNCVVCIIISYTTKLEMGRQLTDKCDDLEGLIKMTWNGGGPNVYHPYWCYLTT